MKNCSSAIQINWLAVIAAMFCFVVAGSVSAEPNEKPCADDAARLCEGVQPGEGRLAKCLKEHASELSPACKENIGKKKDKMMEAADWCKDDVAKLCNDVKPGKGRVLRCLRQHENELSPACKENLRPMHGKH